MIVSASTSRTASAMSIGGTQNVRLHGFLLDPQSKVPSDIIAVIFIDRAEQAVDNRCRARAVACAECKASLILPANRIIDWCRRCFIPIKPPRLRHFQCLLCLSRAASREGRADGSTEAFSPISGLGRFEAISECVSAGPMLLALRQRVACTDFITGARASLRVGFGDTAHTGRVVVATGQQRRPRRRAEEAISRTSPTPARKFS